MKFFLKLVIPSLILLLFTQEAYSKCLGNMTFDKDTESCKFPVQPDLSYEIPVSQQNCVQRNRNIFLNEKPLENFFKGDYWAMGRTLIYIMESQMKMTMKIMSRDLQRLTAPLETLSADANESEIEKDLKYSQNIYEQHTDIEFLSSDQLMKKIFFLAFYDNELFSECELTEFPSQEKQHETNNL